MCQQWKIFRDSAFAQNEIVAREGMLPFISSLSEDDAMMALVTSSEYESTMTKIAKAGYSHRFKYIVCANNQFRKKPFPDLYLHAAELLKIPTNTMFVVEDTDTGIEAASKAGCYCVAFPNEYTTHHVFKNAHYIATSVQDLRDHFTLRSLGERQRFC
jgi:HAD superfamily hydrolase (TIGR01509 family)